MTAPGSETPAQASTPPDPPSSFTEALIIGGGLSGLATAIHLARAGMQVTLLEPRAVMPAIVGESLDWSAPALLHALGLPMEDLIASNAATWKRHIVLHSPDGQDKSYQPGEWLKKRPWNVEIRTLHLDRPQIHLAMDALARRLGVNILREKATAFLEESGRILGVRTASGALLRTNWCIDASGSDASLLARHFQLEARPYGPRKVALWAHISTNSHCEGTNLHMLSKSSEYMEWIWEIPIREGVSSFGYVLPGKAMKTLRAAGQTNTRVFADALRRFPRLHEAAGSFASSQPNVTSFQCHTYSRSCGTNWAIVGEAASQSDPITGNGVTAALRHAGEAAALILCARSNGRISALAQKGYSMRVLSLGCYFNSLIEKLFYQPGLRSRLGVFGVGTIYTTPAWLANLAYSRLAPSGICCSFLVSSVLLALRATAACLRKLSHLPPLLGQPART